MGEKGETREIRAVKAPGIKRLMRLTRCRLFEGLPKESLGDISIEILRSLPSLRMTTRRDLGALMRVAGLRAEKLLTPPVLNESYLSPYSA